MDHCALRGKTLNLSQVLIKLIDLHEALDKVASQGLLVFQFHLLYQLQHNVLEELLHSLVDWVSDFERDLLFQQVGGAGKRPFTEKKAHQ